MTEPLLSEISRPGRSNHYLPAADVPETAEDAVPAGLLRAELGLPEVPENEVVRHFVHLSSTNYGVDTGFYPLGSCTMKYNPKVSEEVARWPGFSALHPYLPEEAAQGALELMYRLQGALGEITGLPAVTLQPAAGAQGELTGMLMVRAYHESRGEGHRTKVVIPDNAHGTNPATATMCGFSTVPIKSDARGNVDLGALRSLVDEDTAAMMLTMPNTLGLFDENMLDIAGLLHGRGALLYGDGANLNALLGVARPADLGFDVMHANLHKTFATPHGGGGPGAGIVAARDFLADFRPIPVVAKRGDGSFGMDFDLPNTIGPVRAFGGSFGVLVRAYIYVRGLGSKGLQRVGENAILNANYLRVRLRQAYEVPYPRPCMHEFVISGRRQKAQGVRTLDVAKRLIDYGFHPPTVYFPLVVEEAMMIEPTETESRETLDAFADALLAIAEESERDPEVVKSAPHRTVVGRLDEVNAARRPVLHW